MKDLIEDSNCVCRTEESGSEGYYVEVIQWTNDYGWIRLGFNKYFNLEKARIVEQLINANSSTAPVFHTMHLRQTQAS